MIPGIYRENTRGKSLVNYETQIYRDVITQAPQEFEEKYIGGVRNLGY